MCFSLRQEHFNLGVDDNRLAYFFFSEALGLTFDSMTNALQRGGPYVDWYNIGRQQFHICGKQEAQRFQGRCHLVLPSLKVLAGGGKQSTMTMMMMMRMIPKPTTSSTLSPPTGSAP